MFWNSVGQGPHGDQMGFEENYPKFAFYLKFFMMTALAKDYHKLDERAEKKFLLHHTR